MWVEQWLRIVRATTVSVLLLWLTACASSAPQSSRLLQLSDDSPFANPHNLNNVPFFAQDEYQCGPAALATVLVYSAVSVTPDELVPRVYIPARQGSLQIEMLAAPRAYGRLSYLLDPTLDAMLLEVQQGRPVLVMQNLGLSWYPQWHYAVVVGYDLHNKEIHLRSGTIREQRLSLATFERTWRRSEHWAFVVLQPGELPAQADELRYFESVVAFAQANTSEGLETAYEAGIRAWPQSSQLGMGIANLYYERQNFPAAASAYRSVLELNAGYAIAHNNLAQTLLQLGEKESARQHAEQAVALGGRYAEMFQDTLTKVLQTP